MTQFALGPADLNHRVGEQLKAILRRQIKATQSSFVPVQAFLGRIDDVLKPRRQRAKSDQTLASTGT